MGHDTLIVVVAAGTSRMERDGLHMGHADNAAVGVEDNHRLGEVAALRKFRRVGHNMNHNLPLHASHLEEIRSCPSFSWQGI